MVAFKIDQMKRRIAELCLDFILLSAGTVLSFHSKQIYSLAF